MRKIFITITAEIEVHVGEEVKVSDIVDVLEVTHDSIMDFDVSDSKMIHYQVMDSK